MTRHRRLLRQVAGVACVLLGCAALPAADPPKDDEVVRQRQDFLARRADQFVVSTEKSKEKPLVREKEPILRFSNPARGLLADGAIYVWLVAERPAVVACLRIRPDGGVWREFTSLSDQPLKCERDGKVIWSPTTGGLAWKPLPEAPKPAATPALRLAQTRRLAERFSADFGMGSTDRWEELRLLPQPIYRYTADKGTVEGAIFALAQSNDPEAIVLIELTRPAADATPTWSYAIARTSSQRMRARLDDKEVWSVNGYWSNPRSKEDPYQEAADGKFPDGAPAGPPPKGK
jgi:hypothetical protein